ncbi:MurR/RpiR family transcriptional regulator [Citrobacter amalonaticus]|uniref:MurR/RpiR family transcriptional regulator n=1 Tax=Citrobacter amalonaticus TaxID=35703 RepID=A0A2S4RXT3_CITAM|nr:MurR/RpiR family transcriptional regulator [Citrobacter amalonaticus]POT56239.1 MurR/RpiR family transcriptional regulator [Citrobacter amalonaticus]POT74548.1 MurR/RpiR family transcriptional regulator [Citrobacter amalonaticus]POU65347.1 MurR/RpiR family transcriptional regulator [Citrobacter amalonaticus]POV04182.1 MurR/RpiR family transcriptional regulator [Citrobacter amalonaticus]
MNTFSRTERIVYEYILCNTHRLAMMSAKTIASETFTTTTSVNRVSKKMGYSGYTELRYKWSSEQHGKMPVCTSETDSTENEINSLCQTLSNASHVYLYARGATITSLNYLSRFISIAGIPHLELTDVHQLALINKGMLLIVSKSGETKDITEMARSAKRKNIKVIAITQKNSTLSRIASRSWCIETTTDASSLYQRESQIRLLNFIDGIGYRLLNTSDT